jgi:hypothetical protein
MEVVMDLKSVPLIEGELPSDAEPFKRYVFLRVTNGSEGPSQLVLRVRPHVEPAEQTRRELKRQYNQLNFEMLANGSIARTKEGTLTITRGSDHLWDHSIEAANLLRVVLGKPVEMITVPPDPLPFELRA